jgi:hypothetical protein
MTTRKIRPAANGADHQLLFGSSTNSLTECRCARCGELKQLSDMAPDCRRRNGRRTVCCDCRSNYDRQRYLAKRELVLAQQHQYRKNNPGVRWAASYRERALRFGFTPVVEVLTPEDLIAQWGDHCVYCGRGPFEQADHVTPVAAGGHHVRNNVVPCCRKCNQWKRWAYDESAIRRYRAADGARPASSASASRS